MHIYTQAMGFTSSFWESWMDPVGNSGDAHVEHHMFCSILIYIYYICNTFPINSIHPGIRILRPSEGTVLLPIGFKRDHPKPSA